MAQFLGKGSPRPPKTSKIGDEAIPETFIIYDYLEAKFPSVKTQHTGNAYKWAKDRLFATRISQNLAPKIGGLVKEPEKNFSEIATKLKTVNSILSKRGTDYIGGSSPNYADYYLWGWVELIPAIKAAHNLKFDLDREEYKHYWAWISRMDKNKHIEQDRIDRKVNLKLRTEFFKSVIAGKPNVLVGL
ncbi:uncharacterized protein TRIADDRAFT_62355 [Trichoplax adhaerens]|uniref:GST C-terminal domain-containing protein n=1 Tax=Trichoplax adhaerens TaxID=10228 RepID=B3SDJ6_TRIAD|nr:hypothetical protein TRIADDRAFT_62355 [Trichoplax adhaerens]EDV19189.1 hypothetical protein TRIADDRAFT_62355 [Trichoplax adhaerens]|eukprot:XP_002118309.1 hypothetical protein TRIADDRAFT_62355 [Trichoplax adhaerens]